jgi:hypothetical protein
MNNQSWINQIVWNEKLAPMENLDNEVIYTLYLADFLKMPEVPYKELVEIDLDLRALLN